MDSTLPRLIYQAAEEWGRPPRPPFPSRTTRPHHPHSSSPLKCGSDRQRERGDVSPPVDRPTLSIRQDRVLPPGARTSSSALLLSLQNRIPPLCQKMATPPRISGPLPVEAGLAGGMFLPILREKHGMATLDACFRPLAKTCPPAHLPGLCPRPTCRMPGQLHPHPPPNPARIIRIGPPLWTAVTCHRFNDATGRASGVT